MSATWRFDVWSRRRLQQKARAQLAIRLCHRISQHHTDCQERHSGTPQEYLAFGLPRLDKMYGRQRNVGQQDGHQQHDSTIGPFLSTNDGVNNCHALIIQIVQASPCAVHADTVVMRLAILGLLAVMGDNHHSANGTGRERLSHNVGPSASFQQRHGDSRILFVLSVKRDFRVTVGPRRVPFAGTTVGRRIPGDARVSCYLGITGGLSVMREGCAASWRMVWRADCRADSK